MLSVNTGLGSFSSLELLVVAGAPPFPCTAWVWVLSNVIQLSQVGVDGGVWKVHPGTEHSNGLGGAIVDVEKCGKAQDNLIPLELLEITYDSESIDNIWSILLKQKKAMNHLITYQML